MKTRAGFVSNSSSSSFLVAVKGSDAEDRDSAVFAALGLVQDTVATKLFKPFVKCLAGGEEFTEDLLLEDFESLDEYIESYGRAQWKKSDECKALQLVQEGWIVRRVNVSNESGDPVETFFYEGESFKVDTPTIKIF